MRDDGSTDGTAAILAEHARRRPDLIRLVDGGGQRLGACRNFSTLLELCDADYVLFADQDDCWLPDKIARTLARMKLSESLYGKELPLLVHSDLTVADEALRPIHPSLWRYQRLDVHGGAALPRLLVQNVVTGCAAMLNRPLVQACTPIPQEVVMHDWWVALVASILGRVECLDEPMVLYRQHAANRVGASGRGLGRLLGMGRPGVGNRAGATCGRPAASGIAACALRPAAFVAAAGPFGNLRAFGRTGALTKAMAVAPPRLVHA